VIIEKNHINESKVGISTHSCVEVAQLKIFGIDLKPQENSKFYEELAADVDITSEPEHISSFLRDYFALGIFHRDMYKYKIDKQDQAKFVLLFDFAPKRVNSPLPGEFELVKIKSNGVDLIRIFILDEQVKIEFHQLYDARDRGLG